MIRSRSFRLALFLLFAVVACGDDDNSTGPTDPLEALVGAYQTQSFVYTAMANPELTTGNLVGIGVGITALTVNADATFSGSATLPIQGEFQTLQVTGTLTAVTSSSLTINFDPPADQLLPNPLPVAYEMSGSVLTFSASNVNFDYSLVGGPPGDTPSTLDVVLLKTS